MFHEGPELVRAQMAQVSDDGNPDFPYAFVQQGAAQVMMIDQEVLLAWAGHDGHHMSAQIAGPVSDTSPMRTLGLDFVLPDRHLRWMERCE